LVCWFADSHPFIVCVYFIFVCACLPCIFFSLSVFFVCCCCNYPFLCACLSIGKHAFRWRGVCCRFALCRVCVLVMPRSTLRSSETPRSDYRSAEMLIPHFGFPRCRYLAFRVSDLGNKGMSLSHLYIKAIEFQYSSVYYWGSLDADLLYFSTTIKLP